jgi:ADP-ribose pyrophosphatase
MNIITKTNIAETRFLNLVSTTYEDKNGKIKEWVSAERPGNQNAVVIVAIVNTVEKPSFGTTVDKLREEPRLVVIREFRVPIQGYEWGLPAGLIDPAQSIEDTAMRELKEETGLTVGRFIRPVTPFVYNSSGLTPEAVSYAFVEATGEISDEFLHASEDITAFLFTRDQVKNILDAAQNRQLNKNLLVGSKAWLIFERFVKYGDI